MASTPAWKQTLHSVIFGHDTRAGRAFDVALIVAILASVAAVMAESLQTVRVSYGPVLRAAEWVFTILFSVEYGLRLACVPDRRRYATSFFGLIDLASILPTYLSLVLPGTQYLIVIRVLRVLRVFRILKLAEYVGEAEVLLIAMRQSRRKISVFIATVATLTVVLGSLMYLIEGEAGGFTSIPRSIYWTVVTITTVGYGDIAPRSPVGQAVAALVMLLGYAIVAVPTGIVTVELSRLRQSGPCPACGVRGHDPDAAYCKHCGGRLTDASPVARPAEPSGHRPSARPGHSG
jgi:voltage-gated potassium channel